MPWRCFGMTVSLLWDVDMKKIHCGKKWPNSREKIKLSSKVSFSLNSGGPLRGNCHVSGQPTEQTHPREGHSLWPLNSALARSINSACFSPPFPMILTPLSLLRSVLVQGMKRVPLVGEPRRKEHASHFGTLSLPLSKFTPSVLLKLPGVANKEYFASESGWVSP